MSTTAVETTGLIVRRPLRDGKVETITLEQVPELGATLDPLNLGSNTADAAHLVIALATNLAEVRFDYYREDPWSESEHWNAVSAISTAISVLEDLRDALTGQDTTRGGEQ